MSISSNDSDLKKPGAYLKTVADEVSKLASITSAAVLHGKFKIDDLGRIKFKTPSAFVSMVLAKPQIQHSGQIRLDCEFAIMLVTRTADTRQDPSEICLECLNLVHRNVFGFKGVSQPNDFTYLPILTSDERSKGHALTALTWKQDMTVIDPAPRKHEVDQIVRTDGTVLYDRENTGENK
ncbi:hypothetical protein TRICHSKD4_1846 [Roseibium sp. TrichSKD4]|uniref:hypothetical protein n=1 Tax=Roseibium sp. TrichSKD4 TaxID=744980 RepID=UPI0001E56CA4|nr:hypothetical protein [Roseibium sp. TrichSKD4]EFO33220.1 hypothetical protein TRICHSKD4_1846 [Roseibium sp. TrichSKD4]